MSSSSSSRKRRSDTAVVNSDDTAKVEDSVSAQLSPKDSNVGGAAGKTKLKVRIKRYHGVSQWVWGTSDE